MGYLKVYFDEKKNRLFNELLLRHRIGEEPINESAGTMFRQIYDSIKFLFDSDNWTSTEAGNSNYLSAKRKYFDSMYEITPKLKNKLLSWINKIPDVVWIPTKDLERYLKTIDREREVYGDRHGTETYDTYNTRELSLQQQARVTNRRNSITFCTCVYPLDNKGKSCLLFFTFDSNLIATCQILVNNKYNNGNGKIGHCEIIRIPEFEDSVDKNEYTK